MPGGSPRRFPLVKVKATMLRPDALSAAEVAEAGEVVPDTASRTVARQRKGVDEAVLRRRAKRQGLLLLLGSSLLMIGLVAVAWVALG